jgi:PIN domain nuclease of toxin-antitoxin system
MRLLLDTHVLIWFLSKKPALSDETKALISDPGNKKFLSIASIWEMAIKASLGKLKLPLSIREIITEFQGAGGALLAISPEHALAVGNLPWHHRDPFDRMLIAQALYEDLTLVSHDSLFAKYQASIIW